MFGDKLTPITVEFGGGLDTTPGILNTPSNSSPNCKNVYSGLSNILQRINDYRVLATSASGTTGNGIFKFNQSSTVQKLIVYLDDELYKIDSVDNSYDGTLDSIAFATNMSNAAMEFAQINEGGTEYLVMATHARDTLQKYDGTTVTDLSADADTPKPKFITPWRGYLFCANMEGNESRTSYNDIATVMTTATAWTALDYQDIFTSDGDIVTGQAILKGRLYTFKNNSIHRWTYFGGTPLFGVKDAASIGAVSSKSIVRISHPKLGEVLVFLAPDKRIYAFDGSEVHPLSAKIEYDNDVSEFSLAKLNGDSISSACALNNDVRHWYMCWVPVSSVNNWCLLYNYYTGAFWPCDTMSARSCVIGRDGGTNKAYFVGDDGLVKEADYAATTVRTITANYYTAKFTSGIYPALKANKYFDVYAKNIPSSTLSFYHRSDWTAAWADIAFLDLDGSGFVLGTSALGTGLLGGAAAVHRTVDMPYLSHMEQFRFYSSNSNTSWVIYGANMVVKGIGYGQSFTEAEV